MSTRHLEKGSTCPPYQPGRLRLYSGAFCPYAQRTRLVLAHKNIDYELVNINLRKKPEWFFEKTPIGLVPVLEDDDKIIFESSICNSYLDAMYPQNKLIPEDPYEAAKMKMLIERAKGVEDACIQFIYIINPDDKYKEVLYKALSILEDNLTGFFLGGDDLNMVDIHFYPFFEKFGYIGNLHNFEPLPVETFPKMRNYLERIKQTQTAQKGCVNMERFPIIVEAYRNKTLTNYDD